jgi:C-terminal processing protease CtpA/Prc
MLSIFPQEKVRPRATWASHCAPWFAAVALLIPWVGCDGPVKVGSIGVVLGRQEAGAVFVREVPPGRAGTLRVGDELLMIDGRFVAHLDEGTLREALRGPVGSPVRLTLLRDGAVVRLELAREPRSE